MSINRRKDKYMWYILVKMKETDMYLHIYQEENIKTLNEKSSWRMQ